MQKKTSPLVSVVTPCYNAQKYIRGAIESVLAQDYPRVEHIIQDGQSTDGTGQILEKYMKPKYSNRLRIFSEPDRSQNEGLSKALTKVRGDILLVLNADDELLPNACTWGVEKLSQNPKCGAVYGDEYIINETGKIIGIHVGKEPYLYERLFCVELVPPAQAAFIRTSMLMKVGLWADTAISTCPDYEMWIRLGARYPLKHEFGVVSKYRYHDLSGSRRPDMTEKLVTAKLTVINRALNSPQSPTSIKQLRFRAYGGLYHWGAHIAGSTGLYRLSIYYLLLSFIFQPKFSKAIEIAKFLSRHIPNYIKNRLFGFFQMRKHHKPNQ